MRNNDSRADIWSLSASELAEQCRLVAEESSTAENRAEHEEAGRLYAEWEDAIDLPQLDAFEQSRRAALIAGLRKRTIEILIRFGQSEEAVD
jgi:hypothetical protein